MTSIIQRPATLPTMASILSRYNRDTLAAFVTVAIDLMDTMDGDLDLEVDDPQESDGDDLDRGWIEYSTRCGGVLTEAWDATEDDEPDDPPEDDLPTERNMQPVTLA